MRRALALLGLSGLFMAGFPSTHAFAQESTEADARHNTEEPKAAEQPAPVLTPEPAVVAPAPAVAPTPSRHQLRRSPRPLRRPPPLLRPPRQPPDRSLATFRRAAISAALSA